MQARIVNSLQGARWLPEGWRLFRAAPIGWLVVAFLYVLFTQILALVPLVGLVALLLVPTFTVGLMAAARAVSRGARLEIGMLFDGFRQDLRPQLILGAIYLACAVLVIAGMRLADDEGILRSVLTGSRKMEEVEFGQIFAPLAVFALIYVPVTMMFWFAPPLAAWHATGAPKALFFSFVACFMNWRAFLAYGAVTALFAVVLPLAALTVLMLLVSLKAPLVSLVFPLVLVLLPTLFASFYVSYRDIFGME